MVGFFLSRFRSILSGFLYFAVFFSPTVPDVSLVLFAGIGPVLGLLFIPLIGSASDDCHSSYGRRRPFIWLLSLGVLLALVIIPHADVLAARSAWGGPTVQVFPALVFDETFKSCS